MLYEEVEMCTEDNTIKPSESAHMHDMVSDVVHVEDQAVTWGQFFQNIGYGIGEDYIALPQKIYQENDQDKITFILNGNKTFDITNRVIGDKDRLIVDFGSTSKTDPQKEYDQDPATAGKYDTTQDPKSCSGHDQSGFRGRMMNMF